MNTEKVKTKVDMSGIFKNLSLSIIPNIDFFHIFKDYSVVQTNIVRCLRSAIFIVMNNNFFDSISPFLTTSMEYIYSF